MHIGLDISMSNYLRRSIHLLCLQCETHGTNNREENGDKSNINKKSMLTGLESSSYVK